MSILLSYARLRDARISYLLENTLRLCAGLCRAPAAGGRFNALLHYTAQLQSCKVRVSICNDVGSDGGWINPGQHQGETQRRETGEKADGHERTMADRAGMY